MAASAQRIEGFSLKDSVVRMVLKGSLSETNQAGGRRELQGEGRCAKQQRPFLLLAAFIHLKLATTIKLLVLANHVLAINPDICKSKAKGVIPVD